MRLALFLGLFSACSVFAWIDLQLVSGDYYITARLTGAEGNITTGSVTAQSKDQGECLGSYSLDFTTGMLDIEFEGNQGAGTGGGCDNESMVVFIAPQSFGELFLGQEINATFRSTKFNMQPRDALVKMLGRGDS